MYLHIHDMHLPLVLQVPVQDPFDGIYWSNIWKYILFIVIVLPGNIYNAYFSIKFIHFSLNCCGIEMRAVCMSPLKFASDYLRAFLLEYSRWYMVFVISFQSVTTSSWHSLHSYFSLSLLLHEASRILSRHFPLTMSLSALFSVWLYVGVMLPFPAKTPFPSCFFYFLANFANLFQFLYCFIFPSMTCIFLHAFQPSPSTLWQFFLCPFYLIHMHELQSSLILYMSRFQSILFDSLACILVFSLSLSPEVYHSHPFSLSQTNFQFDMHFLKFSLSYLSCLFLSLTFSCIYIYIYVHLFLPHDDILESTRTILQIRQDVVI